MQTHKPKSAIRLYMEFLAEIQRNGGKLENIVRPYIHYLAGANPEKLAKMSHRGLQYAD